MRTPVSTSLLVLLGAVALASLPSTASAQGYAYPNSPPPPGIQRYGVVFGGSIGPGAFNFSDCTGCDSLGAVALQLELGGMVAPNIAILGDWTGHLHPYGDGTVLTSGLVDGSIRFFFSRILWIQGGIGIGYLSQDTSDGINLDSNWGIGLLGAFGVEVLQTHNFALDLQARISGERIASVTVGNFAVLIGIHWY